MRKKLELALRKGPAALLRLSVDLEDAVLVDLVARIAALRWYHELVRDVLAKAAR